jgi:hypothetical protein
MNVVWLPLNQKNEWKRKSLPKCYNFLTLIQTQHSFYFSKFITNINTTFVGSYWYNHNALLVISN